MQRLETADALAIRQQKEWTEILTSFETANRYAVIGPDGEEVYFAAETGGSFFGRQFLKQARPFTIEVMDAAGQSILQVRRPWRWYFYEVAVHDSEGNLLGRVQKRFSWLRRVYAVYDAAGRELYELFGPILHPWTFQIRSNGAEMGKITKNWSGLMKEAFTAADNFGVTFPADAGVQHKAILLGAVFLIDFAHFEKRNDD